LWTLLDWVRSWLFTGFPWLAVGYSQTDSPLGDLAPYLGVFGVGWAVLASAGLLRALLKQRSRARTLALAGHAGGAVARRLESGGISWVEPAGPPLRVALVQGNIAQDRKWQPAVLEETLRRYVQLSLPSMAAADVIVWPETAIPDFL
jgi:apolipoprotein N-acyltransferase